VIWIHVADLDQALGLVAAHGGTVASPPEPDGPSRTLATILDSEGNPVGLAAHAPPPAPSP
jgi:predicted enzyme related to lactoylglutathione lyase